MRQNGSRPNGGRPNGSRPNGDRPNDGQPNGDRPKGGRLNGSQSIGACDGWPNDYLSNATYVYGTPNCQLNYRVPYLQLLSLRPIGTSITECGLKFWTGFT